MASSPRKLEFSGSTWAVKASTGLVGPGPNSFSGSDENVWVDGQGRLHLKLTHSNGRWHTAEVINTKSLGFGRYEFELDSTVNRLDPNVVFGLFTWSNAPAYHHREIDIEFSRFGNASDPTDAQFVVQPYQRAGNLRRITLSGVPLSTNSFDWRANTVSFVSPRAAPSTWTYAGPDVPQPGGEQVHINLWLFRGAPPRNGETVEVVVKRFTFTPARAGD
jgi:hypothetical protein